MKLSLKNFFFVAVAATTGVLLAGLGMHYGRSSVPVIRAAHNGFDSGVV